MQKGDYLQSILRSNKTVLTLKDIALLWQDADTDAARVRLNYYVKKGDLYRIRRGLYAKGKEYNILELATRVFTPSYVSFETVLAREGLIFQYQAQITVASYLSRDITIGSQVYSYKKLKDTILTNSMGIEHADETSLATRERAVLDTLYSNTDYYFDNLRSLDWDKVFAMLPMYENNRLVNKVNQLYAQFAKGK
jgi:predicted transcriptional regulator of viral defense system